MSQDAGSRGWTRRQALGLMGMSAAAAAFPDAVFAAPPTFPKGAVIRTILKDYAPDELGGAATLFHEHMSFASDFMIRWNGYAADTVNMTMRVSPPQARTTLSPPPPGMCRSHTTRSGCSRWITSMASAASPASPTMWKFEPRSLRRPVRQIG